MSAGGAAAGIAGGAAAGGAAAKMSASRSPSEAAGGAAGAATPLATAGIAAGSAAGRGRAAREDVVEVEQVGRAAAAAGCGADRGKREAAAVGRGGAVAAVGRGGAVVVVVEGHRRGLARRRAARLERLLVDDGHLGEHLGADAVPLAAEQGEVLGRALLELEVHRGLERRDELLDRQLVLVAEAARPSLASVVSTKLLVVGVARCDFIAARRP